MASQKTTTQQTPEVSPFFRTARELAAYLGADPVTIRRMMRRKAIPYIKLGGRYLFRKSEIDALLERRTVPAATPKRRA